MTVPPYIAALVPHPFTLCGEVHAYGSRPCERCAICGGPVYSKTHDEREGS